MKHIAWGNGEPCPLCGRPFEKADYQHLADEHKEELFEALFGKEPPR